MTFENNRFIDALNLRKVDRPPIWLMRQAGRYLPEYREIRQQAGDFLDLCKNPALCCEVAMQPLRRYDLDAAIVFSDILTIPDAMGLGLRFKENHGPIFDKPLRRVEDIKKIAILDPYEKTGYVMDAVRQTNHTLANRIPLIGFAGSPWTLATYMIEGGSSKTFKHCKTLLYSRPDMADELLNKLAINVSHYLQAQIESGANVIMVFDTWGGALNSQAYSRFSLAPMKHIVASLKQSNPDIPVILFTKGGGAWLEEMADSGCDALGLDWTVDIGQARKRLTGRVALQGNLDPGTLYGSNEIIEKEVRRILGEYGNHPGHIFNLGHGIEPTIDPEKVGLMTKIVQNYHYC